MICLLLLASVPAYSYEIYHWIDENGVPNFSQERPAREIQGVRVMQLEDSAAPDFDPAEDRYGVQAQAERMAALREDMRKRRDEERQRAQYAAPQPVVQYYDPYRSYSHGIRLPPRYPVIPPRPEHPIEVPYRTSTLDPSFLPSR